MSTKGTDQASLQRPTAAREPNRESQGEPPPLYQALRDTVPRELPSGLDHCSISSRMREHGTFERPEAEGALTGIC